jgi:hypothetical protein
MRVLNHSVLFSYPHYNHLKEEEIFLYQHYNLNLGAILQYKNKNKLHCFSPQAKYTYRATDACQQHIAVHETEI